MEGRLIGSWAHKRAGWASFAAVKTLFNYGVRNRLLKRNPAEGLTTARKTPAGKRRLPYADDEVARLLSLADCETRPSHRWLPWLTALSGARIGEVAQLWRNRVVEIDGIPVMKIAPAADGDTIKNVGSERDIPIHSAIIERGFLDFVGTKDGGPLFYTGGKMKRIAGCRPPKHESSRNMDSRAGFSRSKKGPEPRSAALVQIQMPRAWCAGQRGRRHPGPHAERRGSGCLPTHQHCDGGRHQSDPFP
jgi:hypothetical protein